MLRPRVAAPFVVLVGFAAGCAALLDIPEPVDAGDAMAAGGAKGDGELDDTGTTIQRDAADTGTTIQRDAAADATDGVPTLVSSTTLPDAGPMPVACLAVDDNGALYVINTTDGVVVRSIDTTNVTESTLSTFDGGIDVTNCVMNASTLYMDMIDTKSGADVWKIGRFGAGTPDAVDVSPMEQEHPLLLGLADSIGYVVHGPQLVLPTMGNVICVCPYNASCGTDCIEAADGGADVAFAGHLWGGVAFHTGAPDAYYVLTTVGGVWRATYTQPDPVQVADASVPERAVAVGSDLVWTEQAGAIKEYVPDPNGGIGATKILFQSESGPLDVVNEGNDIYWLNASTKTIHRLNLDTSSHAVLVSGLGSIASLGVDTNYVYFAKAAAPYGIYRVPR